jgi:plastocyanin
VTRLRSALAAVLVAAVVVSCGGGGDGGTKPYKEPKGPADETLDIEAGNFYFKPKNPTANAGIIDIDVKSVEGTHTFVFDNDKVPGYQLEVNSGQSDAKKVKLEPGKYAFYCDILGHRAQGMEGTLTVK